LKAKHQQSEKGEEQEEDDFAKTLAEQDDAESSKQAAREPGGSHLPGAEGGGGSLFCACRPPRRPPPVMSRWRSKIWNMPAMHPIWRSRSRASSARTAAPRILAGIFSRGSKQAFTFVLGPDQAPRQVGRPRRSPARIQRASD